MERILKYFTDLTGGDVRLAPIRGEQLERLPYYLRGSYRLSRLLLMNKEILIADPLSHQLPPLKGLQAQLNILKITFGIPTALLINEITAPLRRKLVVNRINFVVPGKQLFMPDLMIDLRERYNEPVINKTKLLPSAQVILLSWILRRTDHIENFTFKQLAAELRYTPMAITNAAADLRRKELCLIEGTRDKNVRFTLSRIELWQRALPFLANPVYKIQEVESLPQGSTFYYSNIPALARYTSIKEGDCRYFAAGRKSSPRRGTRPIYRTDIARGTETFLEFWKYNPGLLAGTAQGISTVDPLSLYLTLMNDTDERVQKALKQLLGDIRW